MDNPFKLSFKLFGLRIIFAFLLFICCVISAMAQDSATKNDKNANPVFVPSPLESSSNNAINKRIYYFVKEVADEKYGFGIYLNDKEVMNESNIPGRLSNKGFNSFISAENVAQYLVAKMKSGDGKIEVTEEVMKNLVED